VSEASCKNTLLHALDHASDPDKPVRRSETGNVLGSHEDGGSTDGEIAELSRTVASHCGIEACVEFPMNTDSVAGPYNSANPAQRCAM
jgi:hypothetical protein